MFLSILINLLLAVNIIVCVLIILFVLMQRPKSEGLGAAFGGGMTENLFGAQTTTVLTNITRWLGGIFFVLTLTLSILYAKQSTIQSASLQQLVKEAKPVTSKDEAVDDIKKQIGNTVRKAASEEAPAAATAVPATGGSNAAPVSPDGKATPPDASKKSQ